jgi:hypothetical protein
MLDIGVRGKRQEARDEKNLEYFCVLPIERVKVLRESQLAYGN